MHIQEVPGIGTQNQSKAYLGTQRKSGDEGDAEYAHTQLRESNTPSVWINHDHRGDSTLQGRPSLESSTNVIIISDNNDPNVIYQLYQNSRKQ